ncbi:WxL domain-containing protein [Lacticaseibacillus baoqingensis]|uniref:WxL domain-containing protein n=1 Tax=Lacticaseibacillus baoqingensis TaxID=2486013 RepID=A0ABW4E4J5_9LACO|nr:WxL domain-containing protein [Lacticaseibacillus baoqingensis]
MKYTFALTGLVTIAGALALVATTPVAAAETTPTQTTKATIDITTNKDGALTLTKAPNFTFDSTTLSALAGNKIAGTADSVAEVSDTRDSGAGWNLSMNLGAFDAGSTGMMSWSGNSATFAAAGTQVGAAPATTNTTQVEAGDAAEAPLLTAAKGAGIGVWDLKFNNLGLNLSGINMPKTYSADVNWYLSDTQTTSAAN